MNGEASVSSSPVMIQWCPKPHRENWGLRANESWGVCEATAWNRRGDGETSLPQSPVFGNGDSTQVFLVQRSPAGPSEYLEAGAQWAGPVLSHPAMDPGDPGGPGRVVLKGKRGEERDFSLQLSGPVAASLGEGISLEAILPPQKVGHRNVGGDSGLLTYFPSPSALFLASSPQETFT